MQINTKRLIENLSTLASIGATPEGGVSRPAFSEADLAGRRWFQEYVGQRELEFKIDGAANQSAILACSSRSASTLLIGSHLDTVPNGGKYDGALGVLTGLEVAETLRENGITLPFHLEIINFTDEEGSVLGEFGSQALT
ncbi:MAG: M20/M25/M40 family metallo-hydrolase, partial [Chloroflexota bacterium]